jgi:hypothetical protein
MAKALQMLPVESSNIDAVGFHDGALHIRFKNGGHFVYAGVPFATYVELLNAASSGGHFAQYVKGKYTHRKAA